MTSCRVAGARCRPGRGQRHLKPRRQADDDTGRRFQAERGEDRSGQGASRSSSRFTSFLISSSALYSAPAATCLSPPRSRGGHLDWHRAAYAGSLDTRSGSAERRSSDSCLKAEIGRLAGVLSRRQRVSLAEDRRLVIDQERGARAGIDENGFADQAPVCTGHPFG
jgi:hypothetical protein